MLILGLYNNKEKINRWERPDNEDTPVPSHSVWKLHGGGCSSKQGVVNPNESRDFGNANSDRVTPNTTTLTTFIKAQDTEEFNIL